MQPSPPPPAPVSNLFVLNLDGFNYTVPGKGTTYSPQANAQAACQVCQGVTNGQAGWPLFQSSGGVNLD